MTRSILNTVAKMSTAAILTFAATAASAATPGADGAPKMVVSYADLDLTQRGDAAVLVRRLHAAAATVCHEATDGLPQDQIVSFAQYGRCTAEAMRLGLAAVNAPLVTALAGGKAQPMRVARAD